jgi:DNA helicase-2/ATP-dependent DNA helicase PcrA
MSDSFNLTDDQLAAINSEQNMVITACPGSGKTTVIVEKIRKEIPLLNNFQGVIGITFTVKASKELKKKCEKDAFNIKSSFFGTIDHFCLSEIIFPFANRIFGRTAYDIECKTYDDIEECYKESIPDLSNADTVFSTSEYQLYHSEFERHYQNGFVLLEAIGVIANHFINNSLACKRYITSRYASLYVDEYQDSSEPQHQLFLALLHAGLRATAVGDVQQSIYAWRGSSPDYINDLVQQRDVFEHHIVDINHRCHPSITNYANRLFSSECELLDSDEIRVYRRVFDGTQSELATQLNTFIPRVVEVLNISNLAEVAVLVRNNRSLGYLTNNLSIPFRVYSDDALSLINSKNTSLYIELLKYHFDSSFLLADISELTKNEDVLGRSNLALVRANIKDLRGKDVGELSSAIQNISLSLTGTVGSERELLALEEVLSNEEAIKQYTPSNTNEVQVMTLHKSKGLEFEVVVHLDLYDWVFPFREYTGDFSEYSYPCWEQDLNLHYVGITRAKSACILAHSTRRLNSNGENRSGQPSAFLNLNGLNGLYA